MREHVPTWQFHALASLVTPDGSLQLVRSRKNFPSCGEVVEMAAGENADRPTGKILSGTVSSVRQAFGSDIGLRGCSRGGTLPGLMLIALSGVRVA